VRIHAYLNTNDADQSLAELKADFETFARRKRHRISTFYIEKPEPAARSSLFRLLRNKGLAIAAQGRAPAHSESEPREELFKLLKQARPNDVVLIGNTGLLTQLSQDEWQHFAQKVRERKIRLVTLDLEASWAMVTSESAMAPMATQLTDMMLEMLQNLAFKEKIERRSRQHEGIARAKARGKYRGRPVDVKKHEKILALLDEGHSWTDVCKETGASRSTVARVVKAGNS
jgi:DNA invertase Pin-like site-specific DNA recombinase